MKISTLHRNLALTVLSLLFIAATPSYEVGNVVSNFSLTEATSGKKISLTDFGKSKAVVVIFTSNYCPYTKLYDERLVKLSNKFKSQGVEFILINPVIEGEGEDESIAMMSKRAKEASFSFPYLKDADQAVAKQFAAKKTPEAFLLQNTSKGFVVKYRGAIDDNPQVADDVNKDYLSDAIVAVLSGKTVIDKTTRPTGCMIRIK